MPVGDLGEPFWLLHGFRSDYDAVRSGGYQFVDGLGGADPSSDLRGNAELLDDPLEDGDVALLAEGGVEINKVQVVRTLPDPHLRHGDRIGDDDLLAAGDSPDQLDHLVVHDVDSRDDPHRTDPAKEMKFSRNLMPDALLFSGWNCVP